MSSFPPTSDRPRVIILGNDAQVAARPAVPLQLARACLSYGYAFAAPASWGDELLAERATRFVASGAAGASLLLHCPLVVSSMGGKHPSSLPTCASVSPPVATARYLRAAFAPNQLHITYVGLCPGGAHPEIDEQLFPDTLLARLFEGGCDPSKEPPHFNNVLPPDRRRFASNPGGAPAPAYLAATVTDASIRDVAPETLATVAKYCEPNERCLLDLAQAAGCPCAADAHTMQRLEPPRASAAVVNRELIIDLAMPVHAPLLAPAWPTPVEPPEPLDGSQLNLRASKPGEPIEHWVHAASKSAADVATPAAAPHGDDSHATRTAESNPAPPAGTPSSASEGTHESGAFHGGTPPKEMPRLSSAVVMGGSVVSLLLAPALLPPAARPELPLPPVTTRARIPEAPAMNCAQDRPSPPEPVSRGDLSTPIAQDGAGKGRPGRRPVELWSSAPALDDTTRLTRRLPGRAHGALVTRRPPDATEFMHPDSTPAPPRA